MSLPNITNATASSSWRWELDPDVTMLVRRDGALQLGWDPERARVLFPPHNIHPTTVMSALRLLDGRRSHPDILWRCAALGISADDMTRILAELEAGAIVRRRPVTDAGMRTLAVIGRGPLADAVAAGLRPSSRVVRDADRLQDGAGDFDCVVLADRTVPDPDTVRALMSSATAHLPVRLRDGRGLIGPLVLPGHTSCLRCADLTRYDYDDEWPYLAAQMLGYVGTASRSTIVVTAAMAVAQVDSLLARPSGPPPAALGRCIEVDLASATVGHRLWPAHRQCDCLPGSEFSPEVERPVSAVGSGQTLWSRA